jgi:F-type H+-transporting ATPase subunit b
MDATLHALGGILLRAVPTFLLVILLHFYLKSVFFKPLERVLKERYAATEGARQLAQQSFDRAAAKATEYEDALRAARAEVYQSQEKRFKQLQDEQGGQLNQARENADRLVREARAQLDKDVAAARISLAGDSEVLAGRIADSILRRSVA